jgi:hypothetical protein
LRNVTTLVAQNPRAIPANGAQRGHCGGSERPKIKTAFTILLVSLVGLAFIGIEFSEAPNYPKINKALTILLVSLVGLAFIGTLSMNTIMTNVFFSFGAFVVFWGIFIQMGPAMIAIFQRRKAKLTSQQLAIEMSAKSDQQLLDLFPKVFDMSDEQQRELFPSAIAMFPNGFQRSLEALDAARIELQKRNIPIPQVDFQPSRFMQLKENRDIKQVLIWCVFTALFSVPMSLHVIHQFDDGIFHVENDATFNLAPIFFQIVTPILAVISTLGLVVIPCVLLIQYTVFRDRQRKLAALSGAIADSRHDSET